MRINPEYLRRNLLHCQAVGAHANAIAAQNRLSLQKNPPRWLIDALQGIIDRTKDLGPALACYRSVVPERISDTST